MRQSQVIPVVYDRRRVSKAVGTVLLACGALSVSVGCSVNPATGQRQFMLIGESEEIDIGRASNEGIVAQLGLYDDDATQAFVAELGRKLAAASERPDLPWTFQVVDDPVVNAFALPGGFIYVTRGILAHLESASGLAGVLGHEIGHVTARHGASRMSRGVLAQIGLGVTAVVSPGAKGIADAAESGLGLLFLKYGRDDERQADELGFRYSERAGYDPRAMVEVFEMLQRTSRRATQRGSVPSWLLTHPPPEARQGRAETALRDREDLDRLLRERDSYVERLSGMIYGSNPREGYFREDRFLHPDLRFEVRFPSGWNHRNQRNGVVSVEPGGRAVIIVTLATESDSRDAVDSFRTAEGLESQGSWRSEIAGVEVESLRFRRSGEDRDTRGIVVFVRLDARVLQLLAVSEDDTFGQLEGALTIALESFRTVTDRRVLEVQPLRIETVRLRRDRTALQLAEGTDSPVSVEELEMLNGLDAGATLVAGSLAKRVVGRRPPQ
ncbi:MAG: M48 family metalloprotease [Acidobacteriota bacterium]|nr:M48 family metalloprotease [Acidobacteriota bacterium]